jgi:hypothetical protein
MRKRTCSPIAIVRPKAKGIEASFGMKAMEFGQGCGRQEMNDLTVEKTVGRHLLFGDRLSMRQVFHVGPVLLELGSLRHLR